MTRFRVHFEERSLRGAELRAIEVGASTPAMARQAALEQLRNRRVTITKIKRVRESGQ